jgi:hypothetical protein
MIGQTSGPVHSAIALRPPDMNEDQNAVLTLANH